ncbi:GNAT family N-acetyltransferase [Streptomyces albipurpureus]|uniref:GNAT family N-acetyltransferase n=1 Tax=Streptomyces albipurpureus TaxID=2897419 RepID=A0ABT0UEH0_9ACTN|nr:GNAT family N-acetyltransferase [Streptomyces sp. CWNU-1]MCM2386929.1 GNAT family N-acetyltransferase [Streptomyces sp. CWNU-1]
MPTSPPTGSAGHHYLAVGPRVGVRPFTQEDGEEFTAAARASVGHHRPWLFPPLTVEAYATYARHLIDDPARVGLLVCAREPSPGSEAGPGAARQREPGRASPSARGPDRIAGFININNIVRGSFRCGALGYGAFAHASGRGLLREALDLVLRYAFGPLDLHRLEANVQPGNLASLALIRGAGFRLEGYSPDFLHIDGAWRDHERWAITSAMRESAES